MDMIDETLSAKFLTDWEAVKSLAPMEIDSLANGQCDYGIYSDPSNDITSPGVVKDPQQAYAYYMLSAKNGNAMAMFNVACSLIEGDLVEMDAVAGLDWVCLSLFFIPDASVYNCRPQAGRDLLPLFDNLCPLPMHNF